MKCYACGKLVGSSLLAFVVCTNPTLRVISLVIAPHLTAVLLTPPERSVTDAVRLGISPVTAPQRKQMAALMLPSLSLRLSQLSLLLQLHKHNLQRTSSLKR